MSHSLIKSNEKESKMVSQSKTRLVSSIKNVLAQELSYSNSSNRSSVRSNRSNSSRGKYGTLLYISPEEKNKQKLKRDENEFKLHIDSI